MELCEKYQTLISAAVDGELPPKQRGELMEHLAQCPACREIFDQTMAMHMAFSQLDTKVPGDLTADVMAKVRAQRQIKKPRSHWWQMAAAVAACCVLAFLGYPYLLGEMTPADTAGEAALYSAADGQEAEGSPDQADTVRAADGASAASAGTPMERSQAVRTSWRSMICSARRAPFSVNSICPLMSMSMNPLSRSMPMARDTLDFALPA